ncbi:HoxN/HupN/NixA family nickel/cobalt transporter [Rubrivivax gelatinosus]|uniref:HoxN/HupN/NixA family nickel/cobalt transporter n=1 Tax=Rubrivivax gelatinosus TaxID=28068 RepID=UPI0002EC41EA|nr:nickel transporter [Rubrivivax gelatinosus]MBG6080519.1 high-affinity nickel-transport protein [Rubrivivax gelatinosus]
MHDLPADWGALCALVLILGMRHGLDADHLAAIDGLTRVSARRGQPHSRYCGALFSLGHGVVVLTIALLAGLWGAQWAPPGWFDALGSGISIGFLLLIGVVNLRAVLRAPADEPVELVGVRGRIVDRLLGGTGRRTGPLSVMGVGSLFALSFDTLSQSALFAVMAVQYGGVEHALTLGALFVLGMVATDGANGWWISRLIDRTDRLAVVASRTMTAAVACVSLIVAALGAGRMASGWVDGLLEGRELAIGVSVIALIAASYGVACRSAQRRSGVAA